MQGHEGKLPINVKVLFEGEEEVGGEAIADYVRKQKSKLKADFALVCDTELFAARSADPVRGLARAGLHRDRSRGREDRPALRRLRRRGAQSIFRAHRNHRQNERCEGQDSDPRFLQRRESAQQGRTEDLEEACRSTKSTIARPKSARPCSPASRDSRCCIAPGRGLRWKSTACPAASPLRARRR